MRLMPQWMSNKRHGSRQLKRPAPPFPTPPQRTGEGKYFSCYLWRYRRWFAIFLWWRGIKHLVYADPATALSRTKHEPACPWAGAMAFFGGGAAMNSNRTDHIRLTSH